MKLLALLLLVGLAVAGSSCGGATAVPKWEYVIASPPDEDLQAKLQALGAAGWEIVSARRATSSDSGGGRPSASYEMILKRPLSDRAAADILAAPPVPK